MHTAIRGWGMKSERRAIPICTLVKIFHKILQDLTRFHKVPFQNLANYKIP